MFRQIAGRLTGTATSTARFVVTAPFGVARSVLERVAHHGSGSAPVDDRAGREAATEQAAATPAPTSDEIAHVSSRQTGTPTSGRPAETAEPEVVLSVDAPPADIEPPVDVVGEALAAEKEQEAQRPREPQPDHVEEQVEVVYSTSSDD